MTKSDFIGAIAKKSGVSQKQAESVIDAMESTIQEALKKKEKITLRGFATISVKERIARVGRNPQTGETIQISARSVADFKFSKDFSI